MPTSSYIHIPFCKKKCKYCSFVSFNKPNLITGYIYSLLKEISDNYRGESLNTLYFGGGTPSLVSTDLLKKVIQKFSFSFNPEITLELNPDDGDEEYLKKLKDIGINRLSIGSQTFNDKHLKYMGRRHNSDQIITTVQNAKKAGFNNISLDFIYGLPNQTLNDIKNDLNKFSELNIQHLSTYGLKIESDSFWGKNRPDNIPDDDIQADMYEEINNYLESKGFLRYEISNFAIKNYESKHNLNYWNNGEYYGFGVSAHGYENGLRYYNTSDLDKYLQSPSKHEFGKILTETEQLEEEIFLGFRKASGINTEKIKIKFNIDFEEKYQTVLKKYAEYFIKTDTGYALNLKGTMLSNIILAEFLN